MTPERYEGIKRDARDGYEHSGAAITNGELRSLLAALEEAEQKIAIKQITINTLQENYYEAQQTIARQREALEWYAESSSNAVARAALAAEEGEQP